MRPGIPTLAPVCATNASRRSDVQAQSEEESTEEEDAATDPTYVVPQGHGRFALRWSRLATAADNFGKGNAQTAQSLLIG